VQLKQFTLHRDPTISKQKCLYRPLESILWYVSICQVRWKTVPWCGSSSC